MEMQPDTYCLTSEEEAIALLEAYVVGERRLIQLQQLLERAAEPLPETAHERLAALMADQRRRYEALVVWWETERASAPPVCPRPDRGGALRWLQDLFAAPRQVCAE